MLEVKDKINYLLDYTVSSTGCWHHRNQRYLRWKKGYLHVRWPGEERKIVLARAAYSMLSTSMNLQPLEDKILKNTCGDKNCYNPAHFVVLTKHQNLFAGKMAAKAAKEVVVVSKPKKTKRKNWDEYVQIRADLNNNLSSETIAKKFNTTKRVIEDISKNNRYERFNKRYQELRNKKLRTQLNVIVDADYEAAFVKQIAHQLENNFDWNHWVKVGLNNIDWEYVLSQMIKQ
jgi:hypothetical protein